MRGRLIAIFFALSCVTVAQRAEQLLGRWRVTEVASAGPVTAMSGSEAARLVGQSLVLGEHTVHFARTTCACTYERSKESLAQLSADYKIEAKALKLPDPVTHVDANCTEIFIREPGTILFTWDGYFLKAIRSPNPTRD